MAKYTTRKAGTAGKARTQARRAARAVKRTAPPLDLEQLTRELSRTAATNNN